MKRSAFSDLKLTGQPKAEALDQRLFAPAPAPIHDNDQPRARASTHVSTKARYNARTEQRPLAQTPEGDTEATGTPATPRSHEEANQPSNAGALETRHQRPEARTVERHSHDIFKDQVRWMNHLKLDLEEQYGVKVTGNAIVQRALDIVRLEYMRRGDESSLFRALVGREPWQTDDEVVSPPRGEEADA